MNTLWVPVTPGGTVCTWLGRPSAGEAWAALVKDASHMPYRGWEGFLERGYEVVEMQGEDIE